MAHEWRSSPTCSACCSASRSSPTTSSAAKCPRFCASCPMTGRRLRAAGDRVRAVLVPRQHRRRADRRHHGGGVFRKKVHIGYLAAIVAASNAGGAGSVVGDTTTTMMWIDGVSPLAVLDAYVAAGVARDLRNTGGDPAAAIRADHQGRQGGAPDRLGAPRHRCGDPGRGDRLQCRRECRSPRRSIISR